LFTSFVDLLGEWFYEKIDELVVENVAGLFVGKVIELLD
jgi:hypothetical protein